MAEIKNQVREFYNSVGWKQIGDGVYQNARYEDLRPVSRDYIHRCHLRVSKFLPQSGKYLLDAGSGPIQYPEYLEYFGGESLITKSHGQSLMSLFRNRYKIKGLYFLDEPETALSPKSQLELLTILSDMSKAGHAQFIIATHSPILLACPGADIYSFDQKPVKRIRYEETEHYQIYKDFMQNQDPYLPDA